MHTSELSGILLDYWVATAEDLEPQLHQAIGVGPTFWVGSAMRGSIASSTHKYSTDWALAGPIIHREHINIITPDDEDPEWWQAYVMVNGVENGDSSGPTPLVAAMRAFVCSRFGPTVLDAG